MKRVILVHGFNVKDFGKGTTDKLGPFFELFDYEVIEFDTGWRGLIGVRAGNGRQAQKLSEIIRDGDVLVGHSDGCNLINMACWTKSLFPCKPSLRCIYFNPALDKDTPLSPAVDSALVFHTPSDKVVWISKWLPWHRWGEMGKTGHREKCPLSREERYENCQYESLGIEGPGHSGVFKDLKWLYLAWKKIKSFLNVERNL